MLVTLSLGVLVVGGVVATRFPLRTGVPVPYFRWLWATAPLLVGAVLHRPIALMVDRLRARPLAGATPVLVCWSVLAIALSAGTLVPHGDASSGSPAWAQEIADTMVAQADAALDELPEGTSIRVEPLIQEASLVIAPAMIQELARRGFEVTMVEAAPTPMLRAFPAEIGEFVADLHRDHDVDVRLGVGVDGLTDDGDGGVTGIRMADGSTVDAEVVVVGIGVTPNTGWLEGSGLDIDNGVICDATCQAAPGITAAGDVASWVNEHFGERMRVEHWEHAIEHGEAAAARLLGDDPDAVPFLSVPWFWSDQYDRKIQMAGRPSGDDEIHIVEGSITERRFVAAFRRGDRCTGVLGVNRPRHVVQARMKLRDSLEWGPIAEMFA